MWCAAADALPPEAEPGLVDTVDDLPRTLVVRTDSSGDFSTYTLASSPIPAATTPPAGFDPKLSAIDFSFKVECPIGFRLRAASRSARRCSAHARDRLPGQGLSGLPAPDARPAEPAGAGLAERSAADLGVALVELLAYAADNLSYRQDAIANEAYLATARQRVSVRRHARLVDYFMHEGCNARAFVHFDVVGQSVALAGRHAAADPRAGPVGPVVAPGSRELRDAHRRRRPGVRDRRTAPCSTSS